MPVPKRRQKALGFQISHFYGSFSNNIMAVKGLISRLIALSLLVTLVDQLYRKVAFILEDEAPHLCQLKRYVFDRPTTAHSPHTMKQFISKIVSQVV